MGGRKHEALRHSTRRPRDATVVVVVSPCAGTTPCVSPHV